MRQGWGLQQAHTAAETVTIRSKSTGRVLQQFTKVDWLTENNKFRLETDILLR
jgi:hypothetical protein